VTIAKPAQSNKKKKKIYTENYSNTLSENLIPQPSLLLARDKKAIDSFTIAQHRARHTTPPTDSTALTTIDGLHGCTHHRRTTSTTFRIRSGKKFYHKKEIRTHYSTI
jgi:hypothetical protein